MFSAAHGEQAEGWLYRTSVRKALDELRSQTRRNRFEQLLGMGRERPPTPEQLYALNAEQRRVLIAGRKIGTNGYRRRPVDPRPVPVESTYITVHSGHLSVAHETSGYPASAALHHVRSAAAPLRRRVKTYLYRYRYTKTMLLKPPAALRHAHAVRAHPA